MCLGNMAVTSDDTDFMQYTSEWFHRINRGGLFPINDETLRFFVSVEIVTRQHLPQQCSSENQEPIKECVIKAILEDVDVQFWGALISQDNKIHLNYSQKSQICGSRYVVFQWLRPG